MMAASLEPKQNPLDSPERPMDNEPDAIATPEGDNEFAPDQPLTPSVPPIQRPRGDEPHSTEPLRKA
jgi:hypothetical protein